MKKILLLLSFLFFNALSAQNFCEKMLDKNNMFINAASNAVKYQSLLDSDQGIKLQKDFDLEIADLKEIAKDYPSQRSLMNALKLKTYAVYTHYLFKTKQLKELQKLSEKEEDLMKQIVFDEYELIACEGTGTGNIQGYDEESDSYYTTTGQTTINKFSFNRKDIDQMADHVYTYFAFGCYVNNDTKKGDEFFLKTFDNRYFLNSKSEVTLLLAKEILSKYQETDAVNSVNFAAAVIYLKNYDPSLSNSNSEKALSDLFYNVAFNIIKKDNNFGSNSAKINTKPLSSSGSRSEAYYLVLNNLVNIKTADKNDAVEMMKKYFLAEKKTGLKTLKPYDLGKMFFSDVNNTNNDQITNAVFLDNDPEFMVDLSDRLIKHFKEYHTYLAGDTIYNIYLFYKKAGQDAKAKKAFMTIPDEKRAPYKEL